MENIIVISRDKGTVALVKELLGLGDTIVLNSESFEGLIESIKVNQFRLIIIDSTLKYDERYCAFIKFIQEFNMTPFLLLSTSTDTKCLDDIRYVAPDGFLIVPFNDLELKICIAVIQAKFDKNQKNRVEMGQNGDLPLAIRKTLNYIDFNIFKKIEITDLANITKWEKNYFIKIFLNYVGVTPYQYILVKKVEKAKLLIIQTDYPINQISYELGFKSYTNFVSAFKKISNSSPSQFKKLNYSNVAVDTNDMFGD